MAQYLTSWLLLLQVGCSFAVHGEHEFGLKFNIITHFLLKQPLQLFFLFCNGIYFYYFIFCTWIFSAQGMHYEWKFMKPFFLFFSALVRFGVYSIHCLFAICLQFFMIILFYFIFGFYFTSLFLLNCSCCCSIFSFTFYYCMYFIIFSSSQHEWLMWNTLRCFIYDNEVMK